MRYYVYILKNGSVPIYIGKGTGDRMYAHKRHALAKKYNTPLHNKIRKMIRLGLELSYEVVFRTNDPIEAYKKEIEFIRYYGRKDLGTGILLNLSDGGNGPVNYIFPEARKKDLSRLIRKAITEGRYDPKRNSSRINRMDPLYRERQSSKSSLFWASEKGIKVRKRLSELAKARLVNGKRANLSSYARKRMSEAAHATNCGRRSIS